MKLKSYSSNCDWLSFSVQLLLSRKEALSQELDIKCPKGYRIDILPGTALYKQRFIVRTDHDGQRVLTFLCFPHSPIIKSYLALVEVDNTQLYNNGWRSAMLIMQKIHECTFSNFSRIDICCDFVPTSEQFTIIDGLTHGDIYLKRFKVKTAFFEQQEGAGVVSFNSFCLNWGSKTSIIKWKLYNKVKEIIVKDKNGSYHCKKPHILKAWEKDELPFTDEDGNILYVWRLECSIMYAGGFNELRNNVPLSWNDLIYNSNPFVNLFVGLYNQRYITRKNEGHKNHANDEQVYLLELADVIAEINIEKKQYEEHEENLALVETLRGLMRQLELPAVKYNLDAANVIISSVDQILEIGKLHNYFYTYYHTTPQRLYDDIVSLQNVDIVDVVKRDLKMSVK